MQNLAALHDTPLSRVRPAPLGVLTGTGFQTLACHRAATGVKPAEAVPTRSMLVPTDRQAVADPHETAFPESNERLPSPLPCGCAGSRPKYNAALLTVSALATAPAVLPRPAVRAVAAAAATPPGAGPSEPVPAKADPAPPSSAAAATIADITILRTELLSRKHS